MLPGIASIIAGISSGGPVVISQTADPAGAATVAQVATYSTQSIGSADANRIVVLLVTAENSLAETPDSATIDYGGGDTAMTAGAIASESDVHSRAFWLPVPTGTTATFKITYGGSPLSLNQNHASVYRVTGATYPTSSGADTTTNFNTDPLSTGSITIPENGGFIAVACHTQDFVAMTWTNATEDLDLDAGNYRHSTAISTTAGEATISCTSGATTDAAMSWLIFNPA
jgi:hypothetical protein